MRIEKVSITNFQCFGPETTTIRMSADLTSLVGANGTGKTAFLQALLRMFGVTARERDIRRSDFHLAIDEKEPVAERRLSIDAVLAFDELEKDAKKTKRAVPTCFNQMAATETGDLKCRIRLDATWTDDGTVDGDISVERRWVHTLEDEFKPEDCSKLSAADRGHIQMVYVPAQRDAASQLTNFLKGRLWRAINWSDEGRDTVNSASQQIQTAFDKEKAVAIISGAIRKRWQEVHAGGTDRTAMLRLVDARFEEVIKKVGIAFFPTEAGKERDLSELSDGQRSLFHIALTAAILDIEQSLLASKKAVSAFNAENLPLPCLTILAIEEPENNLAPFYLSRIIRQVQGLSKLDKAQVAVSSHSPSILARVEPDDVRYFRLREGSQVSEVKEIELPEKADEAAKFVREAVRAHPELYFARFVILGEGDSEEVVLPLIAEACGYPIDPSFVAVVPLGGRHVDHFWKLLNGLQIPHATLLDLDLGRHGGGWGRIKNVCLKLLANDAPEDALLTLPNYNGSFVRQHIDGMDKWHEKETGNIDHWIKHLRTFGVFFSEPLDLDMSMLKNFSDEYRKLPQDGHGPLEGAGDAVKSVLGSNGNRDLCPDLTDEDFRWYRYLFITKSKPATHLYALSLVNDLGLWFDAPEPISGPPGARQEHHHAAGNDMRLVKPEDWRPSGIEDLETAAWVALKEKGNTSVVAGPGAGKTEFLAQRAGYLLQTGLCPAPHRILAISFKRDARRNLAERVAERCAPELAARFDSQTYDGFAKSLVDRFMPAIPAFWRPDRDYRISPRPGRRITNTFWTASNGRTFRTGGFPR